MEKVDTPTLLALSTGVLVPLCSLAIAYMSFKRNKTNDDKENGENHGVVMTELGYIKSGIDDLKKAQHDSDERYIGIVARLSSVEASAKQAHKRIDQITGLPERSPE